MYNIKFLESIENIQKCVESIQCRKPNVNKSQAISSCLIQGRLFFETALNAPLEIKPIPIFYGIMAFSRALILSHRTISLEELPRTHGLSMRAENGKLIESRAKINDAGTFVELNDTISKLNKLIYYIETKKFSKIIPTASSDKIVGKEIDLKDILSRMPSLNDIYIKTFRENPKNINIFIPIVHGGSARLVIDYNYQDRIEERDELVKLVNHLREKYPFLRKWYLTKIIPCWDITKFEFENINKGGYDELQDIQLSPTMRNGEKEFYIQITRDKDLFDFTEAISPLTGSLSGTRQYATEAYEEEYISEFSLYYMGSFILSNFSRYYPNIWIRVIKHSVLKDTTLEDFALTILEKFMDEALNNIPKMVVHALESCILGED